MARAKYVIEQAGADPGALQRSQQRALSSIGKDIDTLRAYSTSATDASSWAAPAPTTPNEAIARIAAAVAGLLGTPIP